ncbi:MAG: thioredoxin domain-containing protein [Cryomorphaceae bacterium]|nr:thioredoxin domain-containing protein [Cryomorphaceae bacterium]
MKIEIWSDVVCPFCYIGKREFEKALSQFAQAKDVEIEWKSFQLMPDMPTNYGGSSYQYFAEKYGKSMEEAVSAHEQVTQRAGRLGLTYNFDIARPANTGLAHQLIHFAKQIGKQDEAEEILFKSYFTDGRNLNDLATLLEIGVELKLDIDALKIALENETFAKAVEADIAEAQDLGVRGVPFFVFDRKYVVSGAQDSSQFIQALEQAYSEWKVANQ